jgi:hypothetical protein
MRALFLESGQAVPPRTLIVDCGASGAASYSHWRGAPPPPPELAADTSTAMVCAAAAAPTRWLAGFDQVANDHVDADGLLALAAACRPELALAHRLLLVGAAEAGDFNRWPGEAPFRLMLRMHQAIHQEMARGVGWQQRAVDAVCGGLEELIADAARPDPQRDAEVAQVLAARRRLLARDGFAVGQRPALTVVTWRRRLGRPPDRFTAVHEPDDLPAWALDAVAGPGDFQLLGMHEADGTTWQLDAPRHSWARTVTLPTVAWPELAPLAASLQAREPGTCTWLARPASSRVGFVCVLASQTPSRLATEAVTAAVGEALAPR